MTQPHIKRGNFIASNPFGAQEVFRSFCNCNADVVEVWEIVFQQRTANHTGITESLGGTNAV